MVEFDQNKGNIQNFDVLVRFDEFLFLENAHRGKYARTSCDVWRENATTQHFEWFLIANCQKLIVQNFSHGCRVRKLIVTFLQILSFS